MTPASVKVCLRGLALASGVCLDVWESIANAGMSGSFGIVRFSGKPGEKEKHCKASRKGGKVFVSFVSPGVLTRRGETRMDMMSLLLIYTPAFASYLVTSKCSRGPAC